MPLWPCFASAARAASASSLAALVVELLELGDAASLLAGCRAPSCSSWLIW